ncbi:MAG TPA: hypothetical protein VJS20_02070, partial [Gemmatimonadales bacterium]|nr:hypothetical protein [Gemmatimonadales bacterium]
MILYTRRALLALAAVAGVALLGFWVPGAISAMVLIDAGLVVLSILDAVFSVPLAGTLEKRGVSVRRDPPAAITVGHPTEVSYIWTNTSRRKARLRIRETRPDLLGGTLPPRSLVIPARSEVVERLSVIGLHRGHEEAGQMYIDSIGPLGLGRARR